MPPIIFLIFALVACYGQVESSSPDCPPKFRKWEVTCTNDRKHCYDTNVVPIECQSMTDEDPKVKSGLYVICYESKLDPNNNSVVPKFALQNINGSSLAIFCQKNATTPDKTWHGIAIKFWATLSDLDLLLDMQIHFSYTNKTLILPQIKKKHDIPLMIYEFIFNVVKTKILDPDGQIHDDYPAADKFNDEFQKKAGLWLAFLDMPSNISSIMMFSEDDCHKFNGFLNDNLALKTAECHAVKDKIDKEDREREEEKKKVNEIMEQVRELNRNCNRPVDPNIPTDRIRPKELINSTRPYNPEEQRHGDIQYTLKQARRKLELARKKCANGNNVRNIRKRQIDKSLFTTYNDTDNTFSLSGNAWDSKNPIPYKFANKSEGWRSKIRSGIALIESRTCLRFNYDKNVDKKSTSYIYFIDYDGCQSFVGREDGKNEVNVEAAEDCDEQAVVAHEIIHRLGIYHEHERNDQDNYVWINLPEIEEDDKDQFEKSEDAKNLGLPYDFGSVMHYGAQYFNIKEDSYTIIAKERAYQQTMGQREKPSFKDYKLLNRLYCDDLCSKNLTCANGGYIDPMDCSKCVCPDGFQGTKCDRFYFGDPLCHSGRRTAYTTEDYIETSDKIDGARECFWSIKTDYVNQRIEIRVHQLNFDCHEPCDEKNYLEIQMTNDKTSRGARLCCPSTTPLHFTLEYGVDALIKMKRTEDYHQFQLTYATPDAVEPDEPRKTTAACACDRMFNPWHTPGAKVIYDYIGTNMYYSVGIKSRSNLIINGKYPFKTQNGNVWFDRKCVYNDNDATKRAYGEWIEPRNKTNVAINEIVAEECQTDYERSGCGEMNRIWQEFVKCLRDGNENKDISVAEEIAKKCLQGNENFRLSVCDNGYDPNAPKVENGIQ